MTATKVAVGDEAFQQALIKEPPKAFASPVLIISTFVAFCCSTANGYDGSLFGTLLANDAFTNFFTIDNNGLFTGACWIPSPLSRCVESLTSCRHRDGNVPNRLGCSDSLRWALH